MIGAPYMNMSNTPALRSPPRRVSLQEVMLAQTMWDEPPVTDLMVYRQPLSDVPVPASWNPSSPVPLDPLEPPAKAPEWLPDDDETIGWESTGVSRAPWQGPERRAGPCRIADRERAARFSRSRNLAFAAMTCLVISWVLVLV